VEYSRNLLFVRGAQMEQVFQRMVDRTRGRLDVRQVRTLFGTARRRTGTGNVDLGWKSCSRHLCMT